MAQKSKKELNIEFIEACKNGDLKKVKYVLTSTDLAEHAYIHAQDDYGFRLACGNGHLEIVKYLLTSPDLKEHANIHSNDDYGFRYACAEGHLEMVKWFMDQKEIKVRPNIHAGDDTGFKWACSNGCHEVVSYLINETGEFTTENIKAMHIADIAKISKQEIIEMIKTRDLKNQLSNEVSLKNTKPRTKSPGI